MPPLPIDPSVEKALLRKRILAERKAIPDDQRKVRDAAIRAALLRLPAFEACELLLCYYPVRGEIDPLPLLPHAWARGKRVAFPVSHTQTCTLTFHEIRSLDELTVGAYGIPEPSRESPSITDFSGALCLVPALALDRDGYRLGYGKGYYDRFLSLLHGGSVGLLDSRFLQERLPRDGTDRPVDRILTEKGELCHEAQGGDLSKQSLAIQATDS